MKSIFLCALAFLFAGRVFPAGLTAAGDDPVKLAEDVHQIFKDHCVECHGSQLARPKGKFGYILDLKRVAANPDYIVPGNPEKSDLYNLIEDDEMPGEKAKSPPLSDDEKAVVKHWVEVGAPCGPSTEPAPPQKPPEGTLTHALHWLGNFHPVTTHFPVALLMVAAFAEMIGWATRREQWTETVRFLVVLAAVGAVVSVSTGWVNAYFSSYSKQPFALLWWHRWLGTGTAVWALLCAMASLRNQTNDRHAFRVTLFLGAALVGLTGFLGSALIYGLDHYAWR